MSEQHSAPPVLYDPDPSPFEAARVYEFAARVMACHQGRVEGCDIEAMAVELGLMGRLEVSEPCGEGCECAMYGFPGECMVPFLVPVASRRAPRTEAERQRMVIAETARLAGLRHPIQTVAEFLSDGPRTGQEFPQSREKAESRIPAVEPKS